MVEIIKTMKLQLQTDNTINDLFDELTIRYSFYIKSDTPLLGEKILYKREE